MKKSKFTEGEWVIDGYSVKSKKGGEICVMSDDLLISATFYKDSGEVKHKIYGEDMIEANARLIKESPNMHELLQQIKQSIIESKSEIELADRVTSLCHNIDQTLKAVDGEE